MNKSKLTDFMNDRTKLLESLERKLKSHIRKDQTKLSKQIAKQYVDKLQVGKDGKVLNNAYNRNLLHNIEGVFKSFSKVSQPQMLSMVIQQASTITVFNERYFRSFENANLANISTGVKKSLNTWLGISGNKATENGYLNTIISDKEAKIKVHKTALSIMQGQKGLLESKKLMREVIEGNKDKLGVFESYYNQFLYDLNNQIDRAVAYEYAEKMGLEFAVYEGGLIKTSREFCIKHEGKTFHISEILEFNPEVAIPDNYNPIQDLGGYNCRHHLNWISTALAKAFGKDVETYLEK